MNKNKKNILTGFAVLILEIFLLYYLWKNNIVLTFLIILISVVVLVKFTSKEEKIFYLFGFVFLQIFDLALVPRGVWSYGNSSWFGIPIWLPFTYGLGTVMVVKIGRAISNILAN